MIKKRLLILLIALAFVFTGAPISFAYECDHDWTNPGDEYDYCLCDKCGATKPHNMVIEDTTPATCTYPEMIWYVCQDCGQYNVRPGKYGPHKWGKVGWVWNTNTSNEYCLYGHYCNVYDCDAYEYVPIKVKKGKTKRIVPKSRMKGGKVVKVTSSSKKVKVKKNGKVKGKKRGVTAKVTWTIKFKTSDGYTWKEKYKAKVVVK